MEKTIYLLFGNGSVGVQTVLLPQDAVEISQAQYQERLAEITTQNEAHQQQVVEAERQRQTQAVAGLMRVGVDETTARQVLGIPDDVQLPGLADLLGDLLGGGN